MKNIFWILILSFLSVSHAAYRECEHPPKVDYALPRVHSDENDEYVLVVYSCEPGYILKGESQLRCNLENEEWYGTPPTCEKVSENNLTEDGKDIDNNTEKQDTTETDVKQKRKGHNIVEDNSVKEEFARHLDMSCHQRRIKAPGIPNGSVVKYERRKSHGHIFLVAIYACVDDYELENLNNNVRYCSNGRWVAFPAEPTCISPNEEDDYDNEDEEEETYEEAEETEEKNEQINHHVINTNDVKENEITEEDNVKNTNTNTNENEIKQKAEENYEYSGGGDQNDTIAVSIPTNLAEIRVYSESCGPERGGCDHNCRLVQYPNDNEPRVECSCYEGFTLDPLDLKKCHDIDECSINNGGCEQICINIPGGHQCSCESGLQIDTFTRTKCIDINECLLRNGHGPCQDTCHNIWGNYTCSCENLPGTYLASDGHTCQDSGECFKKNNGGCSHKCLTQSGRIYCLCPEGYVLLDDWKTCEDIDECQYSEIQSKCPYGCENLHGSYRCKEKSEQEINTIEKEYEGKMNEITDDNNKNNNEEETVSRHIEYNNNEIHKEEYKIKEDNNEQICPENYRKNDNGQCIDIDECAEGITGCQYCVNKPGGFECTCPNGYELNDDERTCRDIDECKMYTRINDENSNQELYSVCSHECVNLEGSFMCKCPKNFHLEYDKRTCSRDYCEHLYNPEFNKTKCSHKCIDEINGYMCQCPDGMIIDTDYKTCLMVDGCGVRGGHKLCYPGVCINMVNNNYKCDCPTGYFEKEGRCHDIDECSMGTSECSHHCTNKEGSYECSCPVGYYLSDYDKKTCLDIDECQEEPDSCGSLVCMNTQGSYKCVCPKGQEFQPDGSCKHYNACAINNGNCSHYCSSHNGYAECECPSEWELLADGKTCIQQNPCLENNAGCQQRCDPSIQGYCDCNDGYVLLPDGKTCTDLDECKTNNGGCSHRCINHEGWYECVCNDGFKLDDGSCIDINECSLGTHNCDSIQICINTAGSFRCVCPEGYMFDFATSKCLDFDECSIMNGNCSHICVNLPGNYHCSCPQGQVLDDDKKTCVLINECEMNNGGCSHECKYSDGILTCHCPKGYTLDATEKNCVDIDECAISNGGCSHVCENHLGRFACICPAGYELNANKLTCDDIDECVNDNGNCSHICINLLGSYSCTCEPGYQLDDDRHNCVDINECTAMTHECSHVCVNTLGSYECQCNPGFKLVHQKSCEDINECEITFNGGCSDRCINTMGSFYCECYSGMVLTPDNRTCVSLGNVESTENSYRTNIENQRVCQRGYKFVVNKMDCIDVNECEELANGGCSHYCKNLEGSFICQCPMGFQLGEDQRTCVDIDECAINNGECSDYCTNFRGGYKCNCRHGYTLAADGKTCLEYDYCSMRNGGCEHRCTSTATGPKCSCFNGFQINPLTNTTCVDINECHNEDTCPQECQNTIGSYKCVCYRGYEKDVKGNCVDINECLNMNGGCLFPGVCINLPGTYKCSCPTGYKLADDKKTCLELKDNCLPLKPPKNGEIHCTKSRHRSHLYYKSKCNVWCHKGYKLQGPAVRHCNGTGQWDGYENFCIPLSCPKLTKPVYGVILPSKCLTGEVFPGERCILHCQPGYVPADKKSAVCNSDQTWSTNSSFICVPAIAARAGIIKPFIKCPRDTIIILPRDQKTIHVKLEQPKTNVDFEKFVDSYPPWGKHLETDLGLGVHEIKFRVRSPNSNIMEMCTIKITIKEPTPPQILYCPSSFDIELGFGENGRSINWKEPIFQSDNHIKQIFKSNVPGDVFGPGVHKIIYLAQDRNGESSRCEFRINVKKYETKLGSYSMQSNNNELSGYMVNRLENHETYLMCPGKPSIKVETNFPLHVPIGCFVKNVRENPFIHEHRRRHQRMFNNKLRQMYSMWNNPYWERRINSLYSSRTWF